MKRLFLFAVLAGAAHGQTPAPTPTPAPVMPTGASPLLNVTMPPYIRVGLTYNQDPALPTKTRWGAIASFLYPVSREVGFYFGISADCTPTIAKDQTTGRNVRTFTPKPRVIAEKSLWTDGQTQILVGTDVGQSFTDSGSASGTNLSESFMASVVRVFAKHLGADLTVRALRIPATTTQPAFWNPELETGLIWILGGN